MTFGGGLVCNWICLRNLLANNIRVVLRLGDIDIFVSSNLSCLVGDKYDAFVKLRVLLEHFV